MAGDKITPVKGKKNVLITSALPYVNNVPHLGNIIGSLLSADCFSRYSKQRNQPTLYICGTDEYGTATETKALEEGCTPQELCDKFFKIHKEIYDWFNIKFDYFGRTSTKEHTRIVQDTFLKLWNNGYMEERVTTQPYCENHKAFLADRYVEGECPRCHYSDARGDQCDQCGNLLDPFELINPRCKVCGTKASAPVPKETKHVFLLLDKLQPKIDSWFKESSNKGKWPVNSVSITQSWLDKGLEGRSITRDLKWGVPIPLPGYESKVIYVWFDACIGYPSITSAYDPENWEAWWKAPEDVRLVQFMGKDNTPFHAVIFPGCQLGSGDPWTLVSTISTTEYLQYEGGKFSKSRGIGVFGNQAQDTGIPSDVWRYYLFSTRPEIGDTQFVWQDFVTANNSFLLNQIGNFVNRLIKFVNAKCDSTIPEFSTSYTDDMFDFPEWHKNVNSLLQEYIQLMDDVHIRNGLEKMINLTWQGNLLLQYRLDNASLEAHKERTHTVIGLGLNLASLLASIISPFMPATAEAIAKQLNVPLQFIPDTFDPEVLKPGHKIGKAAYLFTRIDEKKANEWKEKYGGNDDSRAAEAEAKKKKQEEKERKKARKAAKKAEASSSAPEPHTAATEERQELPIREKPAEK